MHSCKKHIPLIIIVCILVAILLVALFFNKTTINGNSMEKLTELTKMDFSDVKITDIQYTQNANGTYTKLFVFLNEPAELESKDYYFDSDGGGIYDPNLEQIPHGDITALREIGIELHQIQKHGGNYSQIEVGFSMVSYIIHWYQIDKSYDGESNIVLVALIPRAVSIDVDQILEPNG